MDARSIAATAANKGYLTPATDIDVNYTKPKYFFDKTIYENRVFDSHGVAQPEVEIKPVSYTHLDVYKRQGHAPGSRSDTGFRTRRTGSTTFR